MIIGDNIDLVFVCFVSLNFYLFIFFNFIFCFSISALFHIWNQFRTKIKHEEYAAKILALADFLVTQEVG